MMTVGSRAGTSVRRDAYGVPTVTAGSLVDLAYAQGHVTAHDRAWQLEVERWRSEGTLAAHIGAGGLAWDVLVRRARLDDTARRCFEALDEPARLLVQASVEGVNDGLPAGIARSSELRELGATDGRWQPWTPVGVFLAQHLLFGSLGTTLWRDHVLRTVGAASGGDPQDGLAGAFAVGPPDGSNALVLAGSRTASGLPLVAGDPHRLLERPGVYQQVHLVCPGVDVLGLAFPGVPGVAHVGHTGAVAWAVTNAMASYQDLFVEHLRRDDGHLLARGPHGWEPVGSWTEVVDVRDGAPAEVEVAETARGPVVVPDREDPDSLRLTGSDDTAAEGVGEALSLRTPSRVLATCGFDALPGLLTARSADDVAHALQRWVEPVNSVLVADRSGAVRQLVAGRVPLRDSANRWRPVPAWEASHAWRGWVEHRPVQVADGVAVTANDRRPDVAHLGSTFAPPHRARRLHALVGDRTGLSVDDVAAMLVDTRSGSAGDLVVLLRRSRGRGDEAVSDPRAAEVRELVLGWDGRADAGSRGAGAFAAWRSALVRRVVALDLLAPLHAPAGAPSPLLPWLSPVERVAAALPRLLTALPAHGVDVEALAVAALSDVAVSDAALSDAAGGARRTWGATHRLATLHTLDGTRWRAAVEHPGDGAALDGDTDCVLSTHSVPGLTDACGRGPVARYVFDLADRDASRWVVPLGADGEQRAEHAADQAPLWRRGAMAPVPRTHDDQQESS